MTIFHMKLFRTLNNKPSIISADHDRPIRYAGPCISAFSSVYFDGDDGRASTGANCTLKAVVQQEQLLHQQQTKTTNLGGYQIQEHTLLK